MSIKLDDLELNTRDADDSQGTINEIRSITRIVLGDRRRLVEHRIASGYGSILDDAGRHAIKILLEGEFVGEGAKQGVTILRKKYRSGEALPFTSDMTMLVQVEKVLIEDLEVNNLSGIQNRYGYRMVLKEYKEPPKPIKEASEQDNEAADEAKKEVTFKM